MNSRTTLEIVFFILKCNPFLTDEKLWQMINDNWTTVTLSFDLDGQLHTTVELLISAFNAPLAE